MERVSIQKDGIPRIRYAAKETAKHESTKRKKEEEEIQLLTIILYLLRICVEYRGFVSQLARVWP